MADVSTQALQTVKSSLTAFQTDIAGLSLRARKQAEEITDSCKARISQTKDQIAQLEKQIDELKDKIDELEKMIAQAKSEYEALTDRIPKLESMIRAMSEQIRSLNAQISSLRSQLSRVEDEDIRGQIQDQIDELNYQVSRCESQCRQLEDERRDALKRQSELQQKINSAKSEKAQCANELAVQKNRCHKMQDKLTRMTSAFSRVESELNAYTAAAGRFEIHSAEKAQSNKNAIDQCITSIEAYLSTGL